MVKPKTNSSTPDREIAALQQVKSMTGSFTQSSQAIVLIQPHTPSTMLPLQEVPLRRFNRGQRFLMSSLGRMQLIGKRFQNVTKPLKSLVAAGRLERPT
jgi:hypothetical protein